ncbi:Nramp family divalent metal transporter [Gaetbulibacter saemankumensis]|uniref:Nramp family divalent metal transporter n=1 Tax=Gaetbulibacter saemankumensis TaxID=311208 RepID=UPI00040FBA11|nr:Nramp family divalent metal transporter [Gaetbulibacter saemankumensis]
MKEWFKNIGPGPLVAAAFIGPGTVTVCTLAGVNFGYSLLWAMVLSVVATIVLQGMSARLGLISQQGLAEVIRSEIKSPLIKIFALVLILMAIVVGNAAYEAGNITGGVLGLEALIENPSLQIGNFTLKGFNVLIGVLAFILLYIGNYKVIEKVLIFLVILMSMAFLVTAIITKPDYVLVFKSMFRPQVSKESILTIMALIGTTVVPYNLFLHASLVKEKWHRSSDLSLVNKDTVVAVVLGGLVSMSIIIAATSIQSSTINNAADLAKSLEPLFGSFARYFLAIGLFAAGMTSAITAPLAAAYVTTGCLGWPSHLKSKRFKAVWIVVLFIGVFCSSLGIKPIEVIKFAQIANGVLLPFIAGFLIWVVNKSSVLGTYKNSLKQNIIALIIFGISILLSVVTLIKVLHITLN